MGVQYAESHSNKLNCFDGIVSFRISLSLIDPSDRAM